MPPKNLIESYEDTETTELFTCYRFTILNCLCVDWSVSDDVNYSLVPGPVRPKTTLPGRHYTAFCNTLWIPRISPKHGLCRRSYLGYQKRDRDEILIYHSTILEVSSCAISAPKHFQIVEKKITVTRHFRTSFFVLLVDFEDDAKMVAQTLLIFFLRPQNVWSRSNYFKWSVMRLSMLNKLFSSVEPTKTIRCGQSISPVWLAWLKTNFN